MTPRDQKVRRAVSNKGNKRMAFLENEARHSTLCVEQDQPEAADPDEELDPTEWEKHLRRQEDEEAPTLRDIWPKDKKGEVSDGK